MTDRCGTCKHWRQPLEEWNRKRYAGYGSCDAVPHGNGFETNHGEDVLTLAAYVEDGSGYKADLITRADFGCVLHTANEEDR